MHTNTHWTHHVQKHGWKAVAGLCVLATVLLVLEVPDIEKLRQGQLTESVTTTKPADAARRVVRKGKRRVRRVTRRIVTSNTPKLHNAANSGATFIEPAAPSSSSLSSVSIERFPSMIRTMMPVSRTPNWGVMTSPKQWNRSYSDLSEEDFVKIPQYDLTVLTRPMKTLLKPRNVDAITAKLFYSTRYFGSYDLDAGEYTGHHNGIDLKLALNTPIAAIAGGKVFKVETSDILGLHVVIEHRNHAGEVFFSTYGHLGSVSVSVNDIVEPGTQIGKVGMTGNTSAPHLHLQVDSATQSMHPMQFIARFARGED